MKSPTGFPVLAPLTPRGLQASGAKRIPDGEDPLG
jgi:hypothetical protein